VIAACGVFEIVTEGSSWLHPIGKLELVVLIVLLRVGHELPIKSRFGFAGQLVGDLTIFELAAYPCVMSLTNFPEWLEAKQAKQSRGWFDFYDPWDFRQHDLQLALFNPGLGIYGRPCLVFEELRQ
jgi:hypothetical protein